MCAVRELDPVIVEKLGRVMNGELSLKSNPVEFIDLFQRLLDERIIYRMDVFWKEFHNFLWDNQFIGELPFQNV